MGYHQAGFNVTGVDINPQKHYPFDFHQADAIEFIQQFGSQFDAIHASPPCQVHSKTKHLANKNHPDLIEQTREILIQLGLPYVIENVPGAPLINPQRLEGQMFPQLRTHRPRIFETNWNLELPALIPPPPQSVKMGRNPTGNQWIQCVGNFINVPHGRIAMGIDWMTQKELAQAIPPAYTEFIGKQLFALLTNNTTRNPT